MHPVSELWDGLLESHPPMLLATHPFVFVGVL
jgi:hypothetical protein